MQTLAECFGSNLKRIRELKKKTQLEVAVAINSDESSVRNYEHGRRWPSNETIEAIAKFLGCSWEEFFKKH